MSASSSILLNRFILFLIDASTSIERQKYVINKIIDVVNTDFHFDNFEEINPYFKRIYNSFKQMNYSEFNSEQFKKYEEEIDNIVKEKMVA